MLSKEMKIKHFSFDFPGVVVYIAHREVESGRNERENFPAHPDRPQLWSERESQPNSQTGIIELGWVRWTLPYSRAKSSLSCILLLSEEKVFPFFRIPFPSRSLSLASIRCASHSSVQNLGETSAEKRTTSSAQTPRNCLGYWRMLWRLVTNEFFNCENFCALFWLWKLHYVVLTMMSHRRGAVDWVIFATVYISLGEMGREMFSRRLTFCSKEREDENESTISSRSSRSWWQEFGAVFVSFESYNFMPWEALCYLVIFAVWNKLKRN